MSFLEEQVKTNKILKSQSIILTVLTIFCLLSFMFDILIFRAWRATRWLELCPMEVNWTSGALKPQVKKAIATGDIKNKPVSDGFKMWITKIRKEIYLK